MTAFLVFVGGAVLFVAVIVTLCWLAAVYVLRHWTVQVMPMEFMPYWPWCQCGQRLSPCSHGVASNWHHARGGRHHHDDGSPVRPR